MLLRKSEWFSGLIFLLLAAVLPFVGLWFRGDKQQKCAHDGSVVNPVYRVRLVDCCGRDVEFCCVRCVELWLERSRIQPQAIYVTDEISGAEIDARSAHFVRSRVVTNNVMGNRIHVFRTSSDAEKHIQSSSGILLQDKERPFAELTDPGCSCCSPAKNARSQ